MLDSDQPKDFSLEYKLIILDYKIFQNNLQKCHDNCDDKYVQSFLIQAIGNLEKVKTSLDWIIRKPFDIIP